MSKFKPGDVVVVLNTHNFFLDGGTKEEEKEIKNFLYSIGVVEFEDKYDSYDCKVTILDTDWGCTAKFYFHDYNLEKIGEL